MSVITDIMGSGAHIISLTQCGRVSDVMGVTYCRSKLTVAGDAHSCDHVSPAEVAGTVHMFESVLATRWRNWTKGEMPCALHLARNMYYARWYS